MKRIELLLLLSTIVPATVVAQTRNIPNASFEIGINAVGGAYGVQNGANIEGYGGSGVRLLRNRNRFQLGLSVDGYSLTDRTWSLNPALLVNYRILRKECYWYAGAMAGYTKIGAWPQFKNSFGARPSQGYQFGLQAGYVCALSRRIAFNAELAVRSSQTWDEYDAIDAERSSPYGCLVYTYTYNQLTTRIYVPASIGLRYRL